METLDILVGIFIILFVIWILLPVSPGNHSLVPGSNMSYDITFGEIWTQGTRCHAEKGCAGLSYFISDTFESSVSKVKRVNYTMSLMKSPKDFYEEGGDCESRSNAVMCLCEHFGKECEFYTIVYHNRHFDLGCIEPGCTVGHLGVQIKEGDEWRKII